MFKKINRNAIKHAVQSDEALISELQECHRYRRAYGFCLILLIVVFGLILLFGRGVDLEALLVFVVLFVSFSSSASSNNARVDLLEAIAALRHLNVDSSSPQREQVAAGQSATAE